jgi:hypothetical protein
MRASEGAAILLGILVILGAAKSLRDSSEILRRAQNGVQPDLQSSWDIAGQENRKARWSVPRRKEFIPFCQEKRRATE